MTRRSKIGAFSFAPRPQTACEPALAWKRKQVVGDGTAKG